MANQLAAAQSPYLLQHADNPVDWWEWGTAALAEARRREVPIMLSVGYAACHWCHVMAHESFEDAATAAVINASFVAIKVDREERPDIDAVYMQATQALTGQGGWPMTVFLTPDGSPFYAGTYFPPTPTHGLPAFGQVLTAVTEAWTERRSDVLGGADQITRQLAEVSTGLGSASATGLREADLDRALTALRAEADPVNGGFGRAPKFPPSLVIEALLRYRDPDADAMAVHALRAMAAGGIYDQLGGGFARYSVDAHWTVPHFEKMLYDNALLLGCYVHAWRRDPTGPDAEQFAAVVRDTVGWLVRELQTSDGAFAASLDADSLDQGGHSQEGAFYVWTPAELDVVLGPGDGARAAAWFGVGDAGTFERGSSTLTRRGPGADGEAERSPEWTSRLLAAREQRARPGRDDKVVAAWNGWLIASLVEAAAVFERPDWCEVAREAAELVWQRHWTDGRLRRTSRDGVAGQAAGILEDYAALIGAFVRLAEASGPDPWIGRAEQLAVVIESAFGAEDGGFFDTAADAEALFARPRDPTDNATPSGLSVGVQALTRLADYTGEERWRRRAERAADSAAELVRRAPRFAGWLLAEAVTRLRQPAVQVAVVGEADDPATRRLALIAHREAPAGSIVVIGRPDEADVSLLADRTMLDGLPTAYVCRDFVCRLPVTDPDALRAQLSPSLSPPPG